jgi:SAM-dependent methyltransferase
MRDVVTEFYRETLQGLIGSGEIATSDKVLVVCGGPLDESVLHLTGFVDFTVTGLEDHPAATRQDAENLSFDDASFDVVIVHAGLRHCFSPHRALLEMYRVARKAVLAFEARDSLVMAIALRLGMTERYEISSITADGHGGVAESGIPISSIGGLSGTLSTRSLASTPHANPAYCFFTICGFPSTDLPSAENESSEQLRL